MFPSFPAVDQRNFRLTTEIEFDLEIRGADFQSHYRSSGLCAVAGSCDQFCFTDFV